MVIAARTASIGPHNACSVPSPRLKTRRASTKPADFDATDRNAVVGVGAPWYTSGTHMWNGTAAILKPRPAAISTIATTATAGLAPGRRAAMSGRIVEPVAAYRS